MANVKKALYNVAVFLVSLFITGSINVSNIKNTQDTSRVTLTVNETETPGNERLGRRRGMVGAGRRRK